jgi:hypothetical protein
MGTEELWPYVAGGGLALLVYIMTLTKILVPGWVYDDKKKECEELKRALEIERQRGDTATAAAATTRDVLFALQTRSSDVAQKKD